MSCTIRFCKKITTVEVVAVVGGLVDSRVGSNESPFFALESR